MRLSWSQDQATLRKPLYVTSLSSQLRQKTPKLPNTLKSSLATTTSASTPIQTSSESRQLGRSKNIIAVGAGALHGLGYGDNAKAAIITRGLAEITRLGVKLGADPLTYSGLSGVGDLIVTGTSVHSRNWRAGDALGRGEKLEDVEKNMGMVIEGISTTKVAYELAQDLDVYMPITTAIYRGIYEGADIRESILSMMTNELRAENEWR